MEWEIDVRWFSSFVFVAVVLAGSMEFAGCAFRGPRPHEMRRVREWRACQVRPEECGLEAGLQEWAAGLRRLRLEECGTEDSPGPGADRFVCVEPVRFVRYDFDLMPWWEDGAWNVPGPDRRGAVLCWDFGFAAVSSSFKEFWLPFEFFDRAYPGTAPMHTIDPDRFHRVPSERFWRHRGVRLIPDRMTWFVSWAVRACGGASGWIRT